MIINIQTKLDHFQNQEINFEKALQYQPADPNDLQSIIEFAKSIGNDYVNMVNEVINSLESQNQSFSRKKDLQTIETARANFMCVKNNMFKVLDFCRRYSHDINVPTNLKLQIDYKEDKIITSFSLLIISAQSQATTMRS